MTTPNLKAQKGSSFFQDRKMWFWIAAGAGIVTLIVLVIFLQSLISTTKYYVLKQDVAARTLITPDMLQEQVVSSGGQPPNAIDISAITQDSLYAKSNLSVGDILSPNTVGELIPLRSGLPDNFVVASFTADPNTSAGGNIKRGDYIDIFFVKDDSASLLFQRILVIDTTSDLKSGGDETVSATEDTATAPYRVGIPFLYTVGISQEDAMKLALASKGDMTVVLSSTESVNKGANEKTLGVSIGDMLAAAVKDSGKGTDATFGSKKAEATAAPSANATAPASSPAAPSQSPTQEAPPTEAVEGQ